MFSVDTKIAGFDDELNEAIKREIKRQEEHVELIASENYTSPRVLEAQGSVLTNKYAEGYPSKRYYGGCENVDVAEQLAIERLKELYSCDYANVQPHSGSQANAAVYLALLNAGDTLKNILEDVADNIFNPDPYMQQGGDMVRTAGLIYDITPKNIIGKRISNLRLSNGNLINPNKNYVISGWASVNQIETGKPIWEVAREYLQNNKIYSSQDNEKPRILGESDNLGTSSS